MHVFGGVDVAAAHNKLVEICSNLQAELAEVYSLLPGYRYMDPPDGGDVTPIEQMRRMAQDARKWVEYCDREDAVQYWQPIETAPKDGTEILIYSRYGDQYVVSYDDSFNAPWRVRNEEGLNAHIPTHWMPLPEPPKKC